MSTNTLNTSYTNGEIIDASSINELTQSLLGEIVGRNATGVPTSGQSIGSLALPWGNAYINNLILNGSAVDASLLTAPKNRIVSGKTRSASNQPQFIKPNGAAASFLLETATTNLVLDIGGSAVTYTTDITKSGLTVGPSTTATCLVNDTSAADQESTRTWGEKGAEKESITVNTMGAEFQAFIGSWQIMLHGSEYFIGYIKSATEITNCYRGWFTDSSGAPINRDVFSNNDTITVISTGWVFAEDDAGTIDVSYTTPVQAFTAPTSPATGDYWLDLANQIWKRYDGASWQIVNRTLIGIVGIDSSNCVCARSFDFYFDTAKKENTIDLEVLSTEIVETKNQNSKANVFGKNFVFGFTKTNWNITTNLAPAADMHNATEQSSTMYYTYLSDEGKPIISDIVPQYRLDLGGIWVHPNNPWLSVGKFFNDSSSDILGVSSNTVFNSIVSLNTGNAHGSIANKIRRYSATLKYEGSDILYTDSASNGASFEITEDGFYAIQVCDELSSSAADIGVSLNSTQITTSISSISISDRVVTGTTANSNYELSVSTTLFLKKGSIIRPHDDGTPDATTTARFVIERIN